MANSIEENLAFLQSQQGKAQQVLQEYEAISNDMLGKRPEVVTKPQPVSWSNQLDFESKSNVQQRKDIINPESTYRNGSDLINDTGTTLGQAYINLSRGLAGSAAWAATPLLSAANAIQGKPIQSAAQNIESFDEWMGYGDTQEKLRTWESPKLQQIRADGAAIDNNPNLSETERFTEKMKYWGSNPVTALMDGAGEVLKSGAEMALFGGIAKAAGIASTGGRVFAGSSVPGATNHVLGIIDDPDAEITSKTLPTAWAVGAMTGATAGIAQKFNPFDLERWIAGGTVGKMAANRPVAMVLGGSGELVEESIQGPASEVLANREKGRPLTTKLGSTVADSAAIGFASGVVGGSRVPINNGPAKDQSVTDFLTERADKLEQERNAKLDQQLDMTSEKAAPVRVFKQALYDLKSSEEGVSDFAAQTITRATNAVESRRQELEEQIGNEEDETAKAELTATYNDFMSNKYNPLKAEIKSYISATGSTQSVSSFTASLDAAKKNREKLYTQTSGKQVNIDNLLEEIANSSYGTDTTTAATGTTTTNKKSNIASLIQRGESGAKAHSAINYGEGKKSTNLDPTTMTVGDITNGLNKGDFVAVGKYQMHVSSFGEMRQSLPWVNKDTKFTPEVQDRIFAEFYIGKKRKDLAGYITGKNNNLKQANDEFAREWAAAEGSNGKGMHGGNNKATIKSSEVQTHLQEAREIYKSLIDKGASPEAALRTAVMFDLDESPKAATTKRDPSTYIKYTNQQAKRNEPLAPKVANALDFLADMGVTFEINSGGQSNTSKGKVGSAAHNHGNAGDGLLKYNGKMLDWDNPQDKAMLEKIVEEAAANGINGIGAGYMGKGRVHFGIQDKAATWGNGADANSKAFGWVEAAHARGLKRKPSTTTITTQASGTGEEVSANQSSIKGAPLVASVNDLIASLDKTMAEFTSDTLEDSDLEKSDKVLEEERTRLARVAAAKGNVDPETAKVLFSTAQQEVLRTMDAVKLEMANLRNLSMVSKDILDGDQSNDPNPMKSHIGLNQYYDIINQSIATGDTDTANKYLGWLERFANSHQSKREAFVAFGDQTSTTNRITIAPNEMGDWVRIDPTEYTKEELTKARATEVRGKNALYNAVNAEADAINNAYKALSDGSSQFLQGITPYVAPVNSGASVSTPASSTPPKGKTPVTPTPPADTTPVEVPAATKYIGLKGGYKDVANQKEPGFYAGMATTSDGKLVSLNQTSENTIGNDGWLGHVKPIRATEPDRVHAEALDLYINKFKEKSKLTGFIPQLQKDLSGAIYGYQGSNKYSETAFLGELAERIQGLSTEQVTDLVGRIKGYDPQKGLLLEVAMYDESAPKDPKATYLTDDSFGFNDKNKFNLSTISDENLAANKKMIVKVLNENPDALFPSKGLGQALRGSAPKTFQYLNQTIQDNLGIDNKQMVLDNPDTSNPENKKRSAYESQKNSKTNVGKASAPIKETKEANEKDKKSQLNNKSYTNQYLHKDNAGNDTVINISRDSKTNAITEVKVMQNGKVNTISKIPKLLSDNRVVNNLTEKLKLDNEIEHVDLSSVSEDTVELTPMIEVGGLTVPEALVNKTMKVQEVMEELIDEIDTANMDANELVLLKAIINPLLNFNPDLKVTIKDSSGKNIYDSKTNSITLHTGTKTHLVNELARMVVFSSTGLLANKLDSEAATNLRADSKDIIKLNKEISKLKADIERLSILGMDSDLSPEVRAKILSAVESNGKLLSLATTDSDIMKYLQSVDIEGKVAKGNTSVFNKIVSSVKTFFNIGNNKKIGTLYDSLLFLTAKTAELQARNAEVSFKPSEQGKVWLFRDLISEEVQAELEKPYYERNQLIAIFKQTKTMAKPLSSIPNLASKLKIDLMQGLNTLVKESPTKEQREQVEDFLRFRDELAIHLMDTLKTKPSKEGDARQFAYEDKVKFLVKEDGTVDENVLNAAALAAYDWTIEFGNKTANLDKDIKKLLNMEPDDPAYIPANIREQYIHGLMLKANQANAMGQTATSALGIKATEEGSEAAQSELDNSFGEWIIAAMQSADLIHISTMKSNDHLANITQVGGELKDKAGNELKDNFGKSDVTFISVVDKNGANNNRRLKEVIDASRNTKGYLGKIFGMEIGLRAPVKEKPLTTISKIRRTFATVSEEQAKLMKRMQEAPMKVSDDSFDGLMHLLKVDRGVTLKMMGAMITDEELAKEHKNNRHSKASAAEGIYREMENIVDYVGSLERVSDGTREEFYDFQYAAKNTRMHYSSNMVNMQTSKVHRALVEFANFKTDIDITELNNGNPQWLNKDGTTNHIGLLLRAVMQNAEGTKDIMKVALKGSTFINSFTEDKLSTEAALNPFYDYLRSDAKVKAAVEAATKLLINPETVTNKDAEAIAALVKYWGAGTMSYRALLEYTKLNMAMDAGSKTITTTFGMGSDGVNNGTAISQTQLGVATPQFSAQVGIITNDPEYDGINSYLDTRTIPDLGDYYEGLINLLLANKDALQTDMAKAYLALTTSFFERDNSKAILIPFGYNAGLERLKGLAYGQFLEDVTNGLKALSDMDITSAEYSNAKTAMEQNMSAVTGTEVVLPDGKDLLEYWFDSKALNNMKESHKKQIGNFISKNVQEYAGDFIAERKRNVKMQNASSEAFLAVKKVLEAQARETYQEWLADSGMYKDSSDAALKKLIDIEGIPQRVYKDLVGDKLDAIRPTIKTPYNHKNESSAADFTVTEEILSLKNNDSGRAVSYRVDNEGKLVSASNMIARGQRSEQSTGVVVNSAQVQASDAFVAGKASAMEGKEDAVSLNIHDQANGGIRNFVEMVKMQNQATYEVLRDYNVQAESATSLTKTLRSMERLYNDGDIDQETYKSILNSLVVNLLGEYDISSFVASLVYYEDSFKDKYGIVDNKGEVTIREITQEEYVNDFYPEMIKQAVYALYQTNDNRSNILENIKVVSQYAGVDGQYVVTEADKVLIKESHKFGADATNSLSVALTNALEVLGKEFERDDQTGQIIEEDDNSIIEPKELDPKTITNHSGGAYGADAAWDVVGREFGVVNHKHYRDGANTNLSARLKKSGVKASILTKELMDKARTEIFNLLNIQYKDDIRGNLQVRNYYQVSNADSVLAIAEIDRNSKNRSVKGGTNTAVQLAIKMNKPVYVWDTSSEQWHVHTKDGFVVSDTPVLTENFAGVGTRDIENYNAPNKATGKFEPRPQYLGPEKQASAEQAIRDVYAKSIKGEDSNDNPPTSEGQEVALTDFINHLKSNTTDTVGLETADYLVSRIAANNPDVKVLIVPTLGSKKYKGSYTAKDNTIRLSQEVLNGLAFRDQLELINHEVMHAATVRAINNASVTGLDMTDPRAQEVLEAAQTLRDMLKELRELHGLATDFTGTSLENLAEFVAYGTTNKRAMATIAKGLKNDYKEVGRPTANKGFTAFLKAVVSMLHKQLGVTKNSKEMKRYEAFARAVDTLTKDVAITKNLNLFGDEVLYSTRQGTPAEVLKSLSAPNISSEFNEHLDSLSDLIVAPSYIGNAVRESILDTILDNVSTKALNAGFVMSDKELHMMEVVKTITIGYLNNQSGTLTADKLRKTVADALSQLTVDHFLADPANATTAERKVAQKKLNFLVKLDNVSKDEQVERFLAMASANEEVRKILDTLTMNRKEETQDTWFGKVMSIIQDIVQWMTDSTLKTKGQNFNGDIDTMMRRLATIDISAKSTKESIWSSIYNTGTAAVSVPTNWAINNLVNGIFSVVDVSGSSNTSIATIGRIIKKAKATGTMANIDTAVDEASRYNRQDGSLRLGGFGELLVEISRTSGMKATVEALIRMTNKAGQLRDTVKKATIREINKLFDQDISEIPKAHTDAVTQVALRSDISSLMSNGINVTSTLKLLRDPVARQAEITKRELRISSNPNASDILLQTKDLALYMAKGETTNFLLKNAESIAIGKDSWYETGLANMDMQLKADIDVLASLYAVEFTGKEQQLALAELINREPEAVKAMLQMHQDMVKQSKEEFEDNPYNYIKGYTPNLTHHLRSLMFAEAVVATPGNPGKTQAQVIKELENKGWVVIDSGLKQDSTDHSPERALMYHKDMLYQDYVSGALDMKDSHSKGTTVYDGNSYRDMQRIKSQKLAQRRQRAASMDYLTYDPRRSSKNSLVATYDSEGVTISYGYEMSGELRDTYLERNNNAIELLGILQSDLVFKPSIKETQRGVAKSLYQDFIDSYSKDPRLFVTLDPNSTDPEIQKMWKMAPFAFKEEAAKQFGKGNPIVVRKSVFNSVFGFRAFSISEMFEKVTGEKNAVEKIITSLLSAVLGDKAQMQILQGERMWQNVITQTKSFIVIRNIQVLIGNAVSNALILALNDVPISQQIKDMVEVWRNGGNYRKQANRVAEIDAAMLINKSRPKELTKLRRERNTAMRAMEQNPMHIFMEAGLMSTIVEDVNIDGEKTGFKSDLELKIEEAQGYLPDQIITAFSWVMMSPGTPVHDFMAHSTQFSDLAAKYSMAKQRMNSGKSMEDSIAEAQDTFINYDVPTGKGLDYLNRMGLFMFTKFFLRFQSTLIRTMEKKAGSMITQHMGIEYFTNLDGILDPFAISRVGNNPFEPGIINYDNAVSNISTVNFLSGIFN